MTKSNSSSCVQIMPAIIGADLVDIGQAVRDAEAGGADAIHIDVMDGHFAPVITFGVSTVAAIRRITCLPLEVHLMISNPEHHIADFIDAGCDALTVHVESCLHLHRTLQQIQNRSVRAGVAINPATPVSAVEEVLPDVDSVLVMTVNPGFSGFIGRVLTKISRIREMLNAVENDIPIEVDGGINLETAPLVVKAGARQLVAASAIYSESVGVAEAIQALRTAGDSEISALHGASMKS